jgi:hypothetical protein
MNERGSTGFIDDALGTAASTDALASGMVVPVIEEALVIDRQLVETGRGVRVHKRVHDDVVTVDESVRFDEVVVERIPVDRPVDAHPAVRHDGDESTLRRRGVAVLLSARRLFVRHAERGAAPARRHDVRVVHLEAGAHQRLGVVDRRAVHVAKRSLVDEDADAVEVEDLIAVVTLVERELVLEAGAAAPAHRYAETRVRVLLVG